MWRTIFVQSLPQGQPRIPRNPEAQARPDLQPFDRGDERSTLVHLTMAYFVGSRVWSMYRIPGKRIVPPERGGLFTGIAPLPSLLFSFRWTPASPRFPQATLSGNVLWGNRGAGDVDARA